jgi:hypothetical protein
MLVWVPIAAVLVVLYLGTAEGRRRFTRNPGPVIQGLFGMLIGLLLGVGLDTLAGTRFVQYLVPPFVAALAASGYPADRRNDG